MGSPWFKDETGNRYGRLVVTERAANHPKALQAQWHVRCDCGTTKVVRGKLLRSGEVYSCGCATHEPPHRRRSLKDSPRGKAERSAHPNCISAPMKHGHTRGRTPSPTYSSYRKMRDRCFNPKSPSYKWYGERGITVCARWRESFANFLADMGERPGGATLDRINPAKDYEPGNVRWADSKTQARNKRPRVPKSEGVRRAA